MPNQPSEFTNNYETTVVTELSTAGTTLTVADASALAVPCFLTLDWDDPANLEIVRVTGKTGNDLTVTRYLAGSARGSGMTHVAGSSVKQGVVGQMWEDLHDRLEAHQHGGGADGATISVDHGATSGLADDDHPQYLKEKANGGAAAEVPEHSHASAGEAGQFDHGNAAGLTDDDHTNYYNAARHTKAVHDVLNIDAATLDGNAAAAFALAAHDHETVAYKSVDETVNNTAVLQDDDHLVFAVGANETWVADFILLLESASANGGNLKFAFSLPVGADDILVPIFANSFSGGGGQAETVNLQWSNLAEYFIQVPSFAGLQRISVQFRLIVTSGGTAGNVQLRWAQNAATAIDLSLKAGSHLIARQIA